MKYLKVLLLSIFLMFNSSCATAYMAGTISGTVDNDNYNNCEKAGMVFIHSYTSVVYIAIDAAGLPFLTIVLLTGGDGWPTKEEFNKGYNETKNEKP